ncbi:MAG: thiamine-phosphate kinase [Bacteroidetes bacterium]|nr:thiamine-phosphate kinase [Bacteroidota bacterium]
MSSIEQAGEFNLIHRLTSISSPNVKLPIITGIGDDAAIYRTGNDRVQVVTTDALIEGYHFDFAFYSMEDAGYKAMAVNLSDIAAMNAHPILATIALGVPRSVSMENLEALYQGLTVGASAHGVQIAGGDTTRAPVLMLTVTVIGEAKASEIVYRNGARTGDMICVSGTLGGASAGLDILRHGIKPEAVGSTAWNLLVARHLRPTPRLDLVKEWASQGIRPSALIDISDGLANELHHICAASGCGATIWESRLPLSEALRAAVILERGSVDYALNGGDDYELLFTASEQALKNANPASFTTIGTITEKDILLHRTDGSLEPLVPAGHDHFSAI